MKCKGKDCETELGYMAAQNRGLCSPCDSKRRDAKKAKVRDEVDRLERLEEVVAITARRALQHPLQHHMTEEDVTKLRVFLDEVEC